MPEKSVIVIATQFVDLILKHQQWSQIKELPSLSPDEGQALFAIVAAAGFDPKEVISGKLVGNYRDQDGSNSGVTYPINRFCPFKVMDQESRDDYPATGWLDCAFRHVVQDSIAPKKSREQLIEMMALEIERSVPLASIQLTPEGDWLSEDPPSIVVSYFINHTRDDDEIRSCAGIHVYCNGWMDRRQATATHDAIICRQCYLRVLFPREIKTYGELRRALATK